MVVTPLAIQGLDINLPKTQADQIDLEQSQPFVIDVNKTDSILSKRMVGLFRYHLDLSRIGSAK